MIKVGIIGYGYVGKAMSKFFEGYYDTFIYDPPLNQPATKDQINQCDISFVCVPTPRDEDGSCDTSIVEDTLGWLSTDITVIKSTVAVGTTEKLIKKYGEHIIFSPEYIGESSYWTPYKFHTDMKETPFYIFGGNKEVCSKVVDIFLPVTGPCKKYSITDSTSAEMAKYLENSFYATKVAFCNEAYDICDALDVDWNTVRELWLLDPRLNEMHTAVFKHSRGFGGKCLPKDTNALVKIAEDAGKDPELLKGVLKSNKIMREKNEL